MEAVFELVENNSKRDSRGRRITNMPERVRLVQSYLQSGLTQLDFCKGEGINKNTLVYWLKQYRDLKDTGKREHFSHVGTLTKESGKLEVVFPDGACIRGGNVQEIVTIIKALR